MQEVFKLLGFIMHNNVLFLIIIVVFNFSCAMDNKTLRLCSHYCPVSCDYENDYDGAPACCCYYPETCKEVYCGPSEREFYPSWYPCQGCCCNYQRSFLGFKRQFEGESGECEGGNLLFLLTGGCCCGSCCLDHKGHIIPCTAAAAYCIDCPSCCPSDCCCHPTREYFGGQYNACSNTSVYCVVALLIAKYGCGVPIPSLP